MPPRIERRVTDSVRSDNAELVYADERISVSCVLEVVRDFQEGVQIGPPNILCRVWKTGNPYFAIPLIGKAGVLEIAGRRMAMFISDGKGTVSRTTGVLEGFPDLKG